MARTPEVFGPTVDEHTRCVHYATELDIIAIRFACCDRETADHPAQQWPTEQFDQPAILCGNCWSELTIAAYKTTDSCPNCEAAFNPRCVAHSDIYFSS